MTNNVLACQIKTLRLILPIQFATRGAVKNCEDFVELITNNARGIYGCFYHRGRGLSWASAGKHAYGTEQAGFGFRLYRAKGRDAMDALLRLMTVPEAKSRIYNIAAARTK